MTRRNIVIGLVGLSALVGGLLIPGTSDAASRRTFRLRPPRVATVTTTVAPTTPADALPTRTQVVPSQAEVVSGEVTRPTPPQLPTFTGGIFDLTTGPSIAGGIFTPDGAVTGSPPAVAPTPPGGSVVPSAQAAIALREPTDDNDDAPRVGGFFGNIFQFFERLLRALFAFLCRIFGGGFCASF